MLDLDNARLSPIAPSTPVRIYHNSRLALFSVQVQDPDKVWRVKKHTTHFWVAGVTFPVSVANRSRSIRDKQKNVHAFICGTWRESDLTQITMLAFSNGLHNQFSRLYYNLDPNSPPHFYYTNGGTERRSLLSSPSTFGLFLDSHPAIFHDPNSWVAQMNSLQIAVPVPQL